MADAEARGGPGEAADCDMAADGGVICCPSPSVQVAPACATAGTGLAGDSAELRDGRARVAVR
jgi:hypothetical protein